jgi:Protein kinase domain
VKTCPVCSREYPDDIRFCSDDGTTLRSATPSASLVGQVIADRYHVVKKLGEGGMGQVYLAEHVKMGRRSAIKVMSPSMIHDPDAVARFNREAANASRITHPNVCAVYDFGETPDGLIYLAMEFVEGVPLTALIEQEGALPVARASSIFKQTADALQAAHDLGIVHRDLKPDNIMVAQGRDGSDVVKVVDFGIAKAVGGDETGQKVTKTGLVVGTPEFMSPEQLSGDKVDGRSDLYSLALVYFRMLTGQLPFQADSVQEVMIKRLTDEPQKLAQARPDLTFPDGLQEILDAALARLPAERYQTVAKFAEDVMGVVQLRRGTRGGVAPSTRADLEGKTELMDSHELRARAAAKRGAKRSLTPIVVGTVAVLGLGGGGAYWLLGRPTAAQPGDSSQISLVDSTARAGGDTVPTPVVHPADTAKHGGSTHDSFVPPPPPVRPSIDLARAGDALNDLFDSFDAKSISANATRDSAQHIYDASGISISDKAMAAYVLSSAYARLDDEQPGKGFRTSALRWAREAASLAPGNRAYQALVVSLSGQP